MPIEKSIDDLRTRTAPFRHSLPSILMPVDSHREMYMQTPPSSYTNQEACTVTSGHESAGFNFADEIHSRL